MKRPTRLIAIAAVSCNSLAAQIAALLLLEPRDFGIFSLGYLTFGLASSVLLSCVSEAYARSKVAEPGEGPESPPLNYEAIATWLSFTFALIAGLIFGLLTASYLTTVLSVVAVGCAARRTSIRFYELSQKSWTRIATVETSAIIVFCVGVVAVIPVFRAIDSILLAWSLAGLVMWFLGEMREFGTPPAALRWLRRYKRQIVPLLRDSLVLEASAIGTPYLLAPILGPGPFGIYRAVSNFNAPARLVINFIRPHLATRSLATVMSFRYLLVVACVSLCWGAIFVVLLLYISFNPSGISMLDALSTYWLPVGIYMTLTVGLQYFYIVTRTKVAGPILWRGRIFQSSVAFALPITAAVIAGLIGAIWAYALATGVGFLLWYSVVKLQLRRLGD